MPSPGCVPDGIRTFCVLCQGYPGFVPRGGKSGPLFRRLTLSWPRDKPHPGTKFWANQILHGLRANGAHVVFTDVSQQPGFLVRVRFEDGGKTHTVVFDNDDFPELDGSALDEALL